MRETESGGEGRRGAGEPTSSASGDQRPDERREESCACVVDFTLRAHTFFWNWELVSD